MKVMTILAVVIAFDPIGIFLEHLIQQVPTAFALAFVMFAALRRPLGFLETKTGIIFAALFLLAIPGTLFNKLSSGESGLFTAIALLSLPIWALLIDTKNLDIDGFSLLRICQAIGVVFLAGCSIVLFVPGLDDSRGFFSHERAFLLPLAFLPALLLKRVAAAILLIGVSVIISPFDFHATALFCLLNSILMTALIVFMPQRGAWILFGYVCIVAFLMVSPFLGYDFVWELSTFVKGDIAAGIVNDEFRKVCFAIGLAEWRDAPLFGDFFTGVSAYDIMPHLSWWEGDLVPLHNDYLDFLVRGGGLGLFLLVAAIAGVMIGAARASQILKVSGRHDLFLANAVLMTSVVNVLFTMSFNPVLKTVSTGFPACLIIAWLIILSRVARQGGDTVVRRRPSVVPPPWLVSSGTAMGEMRTKHLPQP